MEGALLKLLDIPKRRAEAMFAAYQPYPFPHEVLETRAKLERVLRTGCLERPKRSLFDRGHLLRAQGRSTNVDAPFGGNVASDRSKDGGLAHPFPAETIGSMRSAGV